jgi:NAD+ synthase
MLEAENNKKKEDFSGRERDVFEIFSKLNKANKHKMNPIPICIIPEFCKKK